MSDIKHGRALLAMAKKDWQALQEMAGNPLFADEIFGFHAQQTAEKCLKAWLAAGGFDYPRTHNLIVLLDVLDEQGCDVHAFWPLVSLNTYAVQFRYEAMEPDTELLDRAVLLRQVGTLVERVERALGETAG